MAEAQELHCLFCTSDLFGQNPVLRCELCDITYTVQMSGDDRVSEVKMIHHDS